MTESDDRSSDAAAPDHDEPKDDDQSAATASGHSKAGDQARRNREDESPS